MENTSSVAYNATDKAEKKSAASPKINVTSRTKYLVELALMIAIVVLMAYTPLGYIKTPVLSVTLLTVPVAIGAAILGPKAGAVLGLTFGATSFINSLTGQSAFMTLLMGVSPFGVFVTTVVARVLCGWCTGLIFKGLHSIKATQRISYYASSLACPLLNTLFFMSSLIIFFYGTVNAKGTFSNPFSYVIATVGTQGLIEAGTCFVIASAVTRVLYKYLNTAKN